MNDLPAQISSRIPGEDQHAHGRGLQPSQLTARTQIIVILKARFNNETHRTI